MTRHLCAVSAIAIACFFGSCKVNVLRGEGAKTTLSELVGAFTAVDMDLPIKVVIQVTPGAQPAVELSGYENILKHLHPKIDHNTLTLQSDLDGTWAIDYNTELVAHITVPAIEGVTLSGAPDAEIHGVITGRAFRLDVAGAGTVVVDNVSADSLLSDFSGAAKMEIKGGNTRYAAYDISGAGRILAFPLQADETVLSISGAGKGEVTALKKLTADISGAGIVKYKGHPAVIKDIAGAGSITDAN